MRISKLEIESFMGIRAVAVDIAPDGSLVIVGGRNAQGKSSLLKAIEVLLEGMAACPDEPVRRGDQSARISAVLSGASPSAEVGDLIITRTIRPNKGTALVVTQAGSVVSKPQEYLNRLRARSFRPMEFLGLKPADQLEALRRIVGLDFRQADAERARLYQERTAVNAAADSLKKLAQAMPWHKDAPEDALPLDDIKAKRAGVLKAAAEVERKRERAEHVIAAEQGAERKLAACRKDVERIRRLVNEALKAEGDALQEHLEAVAAARKAEIELEELVDPTFEALDQEEASRLAINRKVQDNVRRRVMLVEADDKAAEADRLTDQIKFIDVGKEQALSGAKFPVAGLGFGENGVTLNGLPFEQGSKAERMACALAIGMSESPKPAINCWLVEDGALIDPPIMAMIAAKAEEVGAQVFLECNKVGAGITIEIENGELTPKPELGR